MMLSAMATGDTRTDYASALDDASLQGARIGVVSYAHDRAEAPSLQESCRVLKRSVGTILMNCAADFGTSGAPVFTMRNGRPEIVSVISAKAALNDQPVSLGALLDGVADLRAAAPWIAARPRPRGAPCPARCPATLRWPPSGTCCAPAPPSSTR